MLMAASYKANQYQDYNSTVIVKDHRFSDNNNIKLLKGEKFVDEFIADSNHLGSISIKFNTHDRIVDDYLQFKIKDVNDNDWYYSNQYKVDQFQNNQYFPFGFPKIDNSLGKEYRIEIKSLAGAEENHLELIRGNSYFLSRYSFPKNYLIENKEEISVFIIGKLRSVLRYFNLIYLILGYLVFIISSYIFKFLKKNLKKIIDKLCLLGKKTYEKKEAYFLICFLIFLALLASRCWIQLISPQVWVEDGTVVIPGLINHGWKFLTYPINGYIILIPKIITAISLFVSFVNYPIISTIISFIFIILVAIAVVFSPTRLKGKFFCALSLFLLPSATEVFGLPLYTFWWSAILLFLIVLWDEKHTSVLLKILFLFMGGLSSPMIVLITPILYFKYFSLKLKKSEKIIIIISTVFSIIQLYFVLQYKSGTSFNFVSVIKNFIPQFFGNFVIGNISTNIYLKWTLGIIILFFVLRFYLKNRKDYLATALLYLLFGSIFLTIIRVDPTIIHQKLAGPRYFFFPFILIFWILLQCLFYENILSLRIIILLIFITTIFNLPPVWSRTEVYDFCWKENVYNCSRANGRYSIPIQANGQKEQAWQLVLSGKTCQDLINNDKLNIILTK